MRTPDLVLVLPLALVLASCGGGGKASLGTSPSTTPSATPSVSPVACTPTGSGTKDVTKKPVVAKSSAPAPAETTTYDVVCGTGVVAKSGDQVAVKYLGVLYADGSEFDSTWKQGPSQTFSFQVGGGVIPGFSTGVEGMRVGGRREVVIPSKDGYGDQGTGPIPPGATLIFVLDLVKIG